MLTLLSNLVGKLMPAPRIATPVPPVVSIPTTQLMEVIIYYGPRFELVDVNSTHDVSSLLNQRGFGVRSNIERELSQFYRRCKADENSIPHYRIAFLCRESIDNAERFALECEQVAIELAELYGLAVKTTIAFY
jgi:hypothetical protein